MKKKEKTFKEKEKKTISAKEEQTDIKQAPSGTETEQGDSAPDKSKSADTGDIIAEYKQTIEELQSSLEESNDKFLRLFSEFDNYRKRVTKERIELSKTAAEGVITSLLPVLDDLERASHMALEKKDKGADEEGIVLIYNKFKNILRQKGIEEIPSEGNAFDTDYHEAVTHVPAKNDNHKGQVVEEIQKGYLLNGKVIRHARVVVAN